MEANSGKPIGRKKSKHPLSCCRPAVLIIAVSFLLLLTVFGTGLTSLYRRLKESAVEAHLRNQTQLVQTAAAALEEEIHHLRRTLSQEGKGGTPPLLRGTVGTSGVLRLNNTPGAPLLPEPETPIDPEALLQDSPRIPWDPLLEDWRGFLEDSRKLRRAAAEKPGEGWDITLLPFSAACGSDIYLGILRISPDPQDPSYLYVIDFSAVIQESLLPLNRFSSGSLMINDNRGLVLYDENPSVIGGRLQDLHRESPEVQALDQRLLTEKSGTARYRFVRRDTGETIWKAAAWNSLRLGENPAVRLTLGTVSPLEEITKDLFIVYEFLGISLIGLALFGIILLLGVLRIRRKNELLREKELQQKVTDRTRELEKLTAEKDRILSLVAHDMKGPLGSLNQLLTFMDENLESFSRENLEEVIRELRISSAATFDLAVNLFHWARNQEKPMAPQLQPVNALTILDKITTLLESTARNKEVFLQIELAEETAVAADPGMLETALRNLTSNAVKFTPPGGSVTLSARREGSQGIISVQDTGVGIPPENQAKLFSLEKRVSTKGTQGESGSGLGLVVCRDFIEKMGGSLTLESSPGEGTLFTLRLPLAGKSL